MTLCRTMQVQYLRMQPNQGSCGQEPHRLQLPPATPHPQQLL